MKVGRCDARRPLWSLLFAAVVSSTLFADPPAFVISTIAGYLPASATLAVQQHLVQPVVVAYDARGTLYYGTYRQVWRLNADGTVTLLAGNGQNDVTHLGDGGPATAASLSWVGGIAIDSQQNVYISDFGAYEIRKVTPAGTISRFAGTGALPLYGTASNAYPGTPALKVPLNPAALAIDTANLFVSDMATSSVLAFSLDGQSSKVVAGNHGSKTAGDGGLAINASLFYPGTLALANNLLSINEAGGARIRQVNLRTGVINTLLTLDQTYLVDNGDSGLATDSDGTLYVQQKKIVASFAPGSTTPQNYAGGGTLAPGDNGVATQAVLVAPKSLAVNPLTHDLAIADFDGNLIRVVLQSNGNMQTLAGAIHYSGDNGPAAMAIFSNPEGIVSDSSGNIYIADVNNNRVRAISTSGTITTVAGNGIAGFSGDNGPAISASLNLKHPAPFTNNLAVDFQGNLYISDFGNGRIRMVDTNGMITTIAGGGAAQPANNVPATGAAILPGPLAIDLTGTLYFGMVSPSGIESIPRIFRIDGSRRLQVFAGNGQVGNGGDGGHAVAAQLGYVYCLATDTLNNIYLCDSANSRVRQISPNGTISNLAGNGKVPTVGISAGQPSSTAIGPPNAIVVDAAGDIFIYCMATRQVIEIDRSGALKPAIGANTAGALSKSTGDGGDALQATFTSVSGMTLDPLGNLYFSDGGTYIREAIPAGAGGPPPMVSLGGIVGSAGSIPPVQSVSPGAIASVFGAFFAAPGTQRLVQGTEITGGKLPTTLAGICVNIGGVKAPMLGVFPNQLNIQIPQLPAGAATVEVISNCGTAKAVTGNRTAVLVDAVSPEFFSYRPDPVAGRNPIAAIDATSGIPIGPAGLIPGVTTAPIPVGGLVEAYGTGWGATNPAIQPGVIPGAAATLVSPPGLTVGGVVVPAANILYSGISPCCAGLYQIDFSIPQGTPSGNQPLVLTVNGIPSPPNAYITVK